MALAVFLLSTDSVVYATEIESQNNSARKITELLDTGVELKITENSQDYTGKVGETAVYSVKAEGSGLKYQWQYSYQDAVKLIERVKFFHKVFQKPCVAEVRTWK